MHVLVTGATGLLGRTRRLCRDERVRVVEVIDLHGGGDELSTWKKVIFSQADLSTELPCVLNGADTIFHAISEGWRRSWNDVRAGVVLPGEELGLCS